MIDWVFLKIRLSENHIDIRYEFEVVDFGGILIKLIDIFESLELVFLQINFHKRHDASELVLGDYSFSERVEIPEVFFYPDIVDFDLGLEPVEQDSLVHQLHFDETVGIVLLLQLLLLIVPHYYFLVQNLFS